MIEDAINNYINSGLVKTSERAKGYRLSATTEVLPDRHTSILEKYGSLSCYGEYFRIFGYSSQEDINYWNEDTTWKFSWGNRLSDYVCFGMDGFGSQYAYRKTSDGVINDETVYLLDFASMQPLDVAKNFEQFLLDEFLRNADQPFDSEIINSRSTLGDLGKKKLISLAPPPVLFEDPFQVCEQFMLPEIDVMIMNGDAACQYDQAKEGQVLSDVRHRTDEFGRQRLLLEFKVSLDRDV